MYFNDHTKLFLDGDWVKASNAHVSLYSQSIHYGIGVFEGIRSYRNQKGETQLFKAREHYERLLYSAEKMHISLNYTVEELIDITNKLLKVNKLGDAYIRPLAFVGADISLVPSSDIHFMMAAWEWDRLLGSELLKVTRSPFERPNPKSCFVDAKVTGHYVNSLLASREAKSRGFNEAILLDAQAYVAEAPGANIFFEKDGILYTPPKGNILPGITRQTVIEIAAGKGIDVKEEYFTFAELLDADGAFFSGTAAEIAGIASIDHQEFRKPYPKTIGAELSREYNLLVRKPGEAGPADINPDLLSSEIHN